MILAHTDSRGNDWFFRIDAPRDEVARISRKLWKNAVRVKRIKTWNNARHYARKTPALQRALSYEAVQLEDLQATNGATREDFVAAPRDEQFLR